MSARISGILFDIAGVLVALDGVPSVAKLLGVEPHHETLHTLWLSSPSVVAHETGKIGAAEFAAGVVAELGLPVGGHDFLQDFLGWPKGLLPGALALLDEIPDAYLIAALSNTCAAHWHTILPMGLADRLDQTYLSHRIGFLKPAEEAFVIALEGMGLPPREVLFVDDSARNVEAAAALGMHAHVARGPADAREVLVQYAIVPSMPSAGAPLPRASRR